MIDLAEVLVVWNLSYVLWFIATGVMQWFFPYLSGVSRFYGLLTSEQVVARFE